MTRAEIAAVLEAHNVPKSEIANRAGVNTSSVYHWFSRGTPSRNIERHALEIVSELNQGTYAPKKKGTK